MKNVQIRGFFWSIFSCIWTEYGDLQSKSPYSAQIKENTDQKKLRIWTLFTQCLLLLEEWGAVVAIERLHHKVLVRFQQVYELSFISLK